MSGSINRNFYHHKAGRIPSYSTAVANQQYLADERERQKREAQYQNLKGGIDLYGAYTENTGHNPISDMLRKTNFGKNSESVQLARAAERADLAAAQNLGGTAPAAAAPAAAPAAPAANPIASALREGSGLAAPGTEQFAIKGATEATKGAAPLAGTGAGAASKVIPIAGGAIGGLVNYDQAVREGRSDLEVAGKTAGGIAPAALMSFAPALMAAGPVGWAGMAGLAALSLYGMIG